MKKILFVIVMMSFLGTSFAQLSVGLEAKNAGNEAYRNKEYVKAIEQWSIYLKSDEEGAAADGNTKSLYVKCFKYAAIDFMKVKNYPLAYSNFEKFITEGGAEAVNDGKTAYYMGYCASMMEKNDLALSQYQRSVDLGYREDACMLKIATLYKIVGDEEKMVAILTDALAKYPNSKSRSEMASMLTTPMLQKAAIPFNEANALAKNAASSDPSSYMSNMARAVSKFKDAIPLFESVLKYDPSNDQANTYIAACKDNIKSFDEYKATLAK
jgi:tetratricopeptide (TPR) repeat protein